jgi:primary-amine oxidase
VATLPENAPGPRAPRLGASTPHCFLPPPAEATLAKSSAGAAMGLRVRVRRLAAAGSLACMWFCGSLGGLGSAAAAALHPLDPLTAEELVTVRDVLTRSDRFSPDTKFVWIELEEPAKSVVEQFELGREFPRRAYVAALDFAKHTSFAASVDIKEKRLASVTDLGRLQPGLTDYDLERARGILDADPNVKDALTRHGLRISGAVSEAVREIFMGVSEDPSLRREGGRLVRVLFVADQDAVNDFGPILDTVMAVVDVYGGRVVRLYDAPGVPIRKAPHDIFDPAVRGAAPRMRPLNAVQPEGVNFTIDGNVIRWGNWEFRFGFGGREGLVLHQIRFDDDGRKRSVVYRASVAEAVSRYGDPAHAWPWMEFLDEGNFGLGQLSVPVVPGREVPANAVTLGALIPDADEPGFGRVLENRIYVYERDAGMLMYYRQGEASVQARATELVVGFLAAVGNYAYGLNWVFRQDGSFAFEAELAGEILTKLVRAEKCRACAALAGRADAGESRGPGSNAEDQHGTLVAPHVVAPNHQHWFSLRLDFDIDGTSNAVMENEMARASGSSRRAGEDPYFTLARRTFGTAIEAKRDADDSVARTWTVYNPLSPRPTGQPAGYSIVPTGNVATVFPRSRERGTAGFTFHHLWVTPYRDGQFFADGRYPNQPPADYADTLYHYAGNEPIHDRDIVVWYSLGETHVPRPEDYPLMPNAKLSVAFVPDGFFVKNPALGLAVEHGHSP